MRQIYSSIVLAAIVSLVASGCGDAAQPTSNDNQPGNAAGETPDGQIKKTPGGKGDRWNEINDPERFNVDLVREYSELPSKGRADGTTWPDTYWPTYKGSINQRWQGEDTLSPVEKYDRAFNDWSPGDNFMELQPYDPQSCEWDSEYYSQLGPAARQTAKDQTWRMHNGNDDDGDGLDDTEECGTDRTADHDGIETWWGLCHAWVPAAILEKEPLAPVTKNGVEFAVSDIKALIIDQYDRSDSRMLGDRCNRVEDPEGRRECNSNADCPGNMSCDTESSPSVCRRKGVDTDETGRVDQQACRDTNAGSFHLILTNLLGNQNRPFAEDKTFDFEVWNQPIVGYEVLEQKKVDKSRARELLNLSEGSSSNGEEVTEEVKNKGILRVATEVPEQELDNKAGLSSEAAAAVAEYDASQYSTRTEKLQGLSALDPVDQGTLLRMLTYARRLGWVPQPTEDPDGFTDEELEGMLRVALEVSKQTLVQEADLLEDAATAVAQYDGSQYNTRIKKLQGLYLQDAVSNRTVKRILEFARDKKWVPVPNTGIYKYNEDAKGFVEVRTKVEYVTESHASTEPTGRNLDTYISTDKYHYLLELDGSGEIIGGEWIGTSRTDHPDFLWLPTGPGGGNPHIDLGQVRDLIAQSRQNAGADSAAGDIEVSNDETREIPDADPQGVVSTIDFGESATITDTTITLDIAHSYRGDLLVKLSKKGDSQTSVVVFDGEEVDRSNRSRDDVQIASQSLNGFENMETQGSWELQVIDRARRDTGKLKSWGLKFQTR